MRLCGFMPVRSFEVLGDSTVQELGSRVAFRNKGMTGHRRRVLLNPLSYAQVIVAPIA